MSTKARDAGNAPDGTASNRLAASSICYDPSGDPAPLAARRLNLAGSRLAPMSGPAA